MPNEFTTVGIRVVDHEQVKLVAWRLRMKIADLVPVAVRAFQNLTPDERDEVLSRSPANSAKEDQ